MSEAQKSSGINAVLNYFSTLTPISEGFIHEIGTHAIFMEISKNKYILSPLDDNAAVYFILKGVVRGFVKDDNKEITTWISMGNEFIGAI